MSEKGDEKLPLGPLVQKIIDFLAEKNFGQDVATIKNKFSENGEYTKSDVSSAITYLLSEYILDDNYRTDGSTFYTLSPKGTSYITPKKESAIVGVSSEDTTNFIRNNIYKLADKDFQKSTVAEQALALFVAKNLDVLNDMEKNAPDLLGVLSSGFKILTNYAKGNTAELSPFVPLENQQQLEDQLKEEDFDLSDVDLQEIDLTGLEEDFEINEDELGDVDLTEFDELADFVESELTPVDIDNLDDAQKEIIRVLSPKGNLGYPLKSLKEIYEDLYESIKSNYQLITLRSDLEVLKLMGLVEQSGNTYNLLMTQKVADVVDKLKLPTPIENKKLTSTVEAILRYLYESQTVLSADEIKFELSTNNIILPLKAIFDRLIALMDKGLVYQYSSPTEGIKWKITPLGKEYIDKLPKPKTAGQAVAVRPSPTESATMNPVGTIKTGNDGNDWQVRASSKGVKRWVKIK